MTKQMFAGKFEVQGEICKGKTGTIYYGYDLELRREVAIKIYHSHINGRLIKGKAFIQKTQPLLKLDHPNLIKIFKVEEEDDTPVVFMEFFDGPSLRQVIQEKGPLSVEDTLILARGIAEVLVHTHFQGIIHGTLHPGHVLVGPQNQIKVMDLGLSWILMEILSNCDEDLLRPLEYLPPESAKGDLLTLTSDLYCLGFMMYEMLTKTTPYTNLPKTSIMGKLAFDQSDPHFEFPEHVPEGVRDLIQQITRNKAPNRLQDATHVLTIINQQLARLKTDVGKITPITEGLQTPKHPCSPQPDEPPEEEPVTAGPVNPTEPLPELFSAPENPRPTPAIEPQGPQVTPKQLFQIPEGTKFGLGLGVGVAVALLLLGAAMGYWFRGFLEDPIPPSPDPAMAPVPLTHPNQPENLPQLVPGQFSTLESGPFDAPLLQQPEGTGLFPPESDEPTPQVPLTSVNSSPENLSEISNATTAAPKEDDSSRGLPLGKKLTVPESGGKTSEKTPVGPDSVTVPTQTRKQTSPSGKEPVHDLATKELLDAVDSLEGELPPTSPSSASQDQTI